MKKVFKNLILGLTLVTLFALVGCGSSDDGDSVLRVGASPEPHSKILALVEDDLKEQGVDLEIIELDDYVTPNLSLEDGDLDANFIQHQPYLESFNKENGTDLVPLGSVHIEPMGVFSEKIKSIDDLEDGAEVTIPNDATNGARALLLLETNGLIKLDEKAGFNATEKDIVENPKNLKFQALEAATLPRTLDEVDISVINGNYALSADLNVTEDALLVEKNSSPYGNIIAVKNGDQDREDLKALIDALQSDTVRKYIEDTFEGAVVPAF